MADDIRIMVWKVRTVEVAEAKATVNITDYLRWAAEEGRGVEGRDVELNDLSVDDFREYMALHGVWGKTSAVVAEAEWVDVEEER